MREPRRGAPLFALVGAIGLALAGVAFGTWAWLGRAAATTPATEDPSTAAIDAPTMLLAPVPTIAEPTAEADASDDPLIIDVDDDPPVVPAAAAREPSRPRLRKKSPRAVTVPTSSAPTAAAKPKSTRTEPRPPTRPSERPNDLFPPSD